jgi:colanic acid biosynthesis glycosyl transferase WcaI
VIYSLNYYPEVVGIGKFNTELALWLSRRGHDVQVVTAPPYYPDWKVSPGYKACRYRSERINDVQVYRAPLWIPRVPSALHRLIHLVSFAISSLPLIAFVVVRFRPHLVFVVEPTVLCAPGALLAARVAGAKSWLHIQDLEIDAAFGLGLVRGSAIQSLAFRVERALGNAFDVVTTISASMLARLFDKGIANDHAHLMPNWVDTEVIYPMTSPSSLRAEWDISDKTTVVLYSGSMGLKQGLDILLQAARLVERHANIRFVLCGQGPALEDLLAASNEQRNVLILPLQPSERLNDLLNLADIHVLPQLPGAADLVMPSKLGGMLASGRPVVATVDRVSQIGKMLEGCGLSVPPGSATDLANAIERLHNDPVERRLMGQEARRRADQFWSQETILSRFEDIAAGGSVKGAHAR